MSALVNMNNSLTRLKRAKEQLNAVVHDFQSRFPVESRNFFDRGDMAFLECRIIGYYDKGAIVLKMSRENVGHWLESSGPHVLVPWTFLFTPEAKQEMEEVRGKLGLDVDAALPVTE